MFQQSNLIKRTSQILFVVFYTLVFGLNEGFTQVKGRITVEPQTGLELTLPKKFKISHEGDGVYLLKRGKNLSARFVIGKTPFNAVATAEDYIATSNLKVRKFIEQGDSVLLRGRFVRKKPVQVRFRPVGDGLMEVILYSGKKKKKKKNTRQNNRTTIAQVLLLDRIIQSRRGGRIIPLPVQIPSRTVTGPGTSALVPNLPGWTFAANDGIVSGGHPRQGIVNLGIPTLVNFLSWPFQTPVRSNFVNSAEAILSVWPQQMAANNANIQVVGIAFVPGTAGWLGPNFQSSALFTVRFRFNGLVWDALFVSGCAFIPGDAASWFWYHSYIAVPVGSSPVIGNALMNTWATWDNTNANAVRLRQTLNTILTTPPPGNPIDSEVFDRIHRKWVDYIKQ